MAANGVMGGLRARILPSVQRRTLEELTEELDLESGDRQSKASAFWTMLTLSAIIASSGVLADSTATVIGAMIIAPLSTPIMGIALAVVKRERNGSVRFVVLGGLLVVGIGVLFSFLLPSAYDLSANAQIDARTSPSVIDLVAAIATGLAGAVALARRDVAAVLPGVAIAISLVPPLAVVGVTLGRGAFVAAVGALLLFLSNLLALVLAGTAVFAVLGYARESAAVGGRSRRRAYLTLSALMVAVLLPLLGNTVVSYAVAVWTDRVQHAADEWVAGVPQAEVTDVELISATFVIHVVAPGPLPPENAFLDRLEGRIPDSLPIVVESTRGARMELGTLADR